MRTMKMIIKKYRWKNIKRALMEHDMLFAEYSIIFYNFFMYILLSIFFLYLVSIFHNDLTRVLFYIFEFVFCIFSLSKMIFYLKKQKYLITYFLILEVLTAISICTLTKVDNDFSNNFYDISWLFYLINIEICGISFMLNTLLPKYLKNRSKYFLRTLIKIIVIIIIILAMWIFKNVDMVFASSISLITGMLTAFLTPKNFLLMFSSVNNIESAKIKDDISRKFKLVQFFLYIFNISWLISMATFYHYFNIELLNIRLFNTIPLKIYIYSKDFNEKVIFFFAVIIILTIMITWIPRLFVNYNNVTEWIKNYDNKSE